MTKLKLGTLCLEEPFFQAALSGYTDRAMRTLAREFGCPFTFSGLMLDKSTAYKKVLARPEFSIVGEPGPVGGQIHGLLPETMARAARTLEEFGYHLIDLNFACPAPKVIRRQRGGYMMRDPKLVREMFLQVRDAVKCPVTYKLRIGFSDSEQSRANFWEIVENAAVDGVDALIIHGRSVQQLYRGKADWDILDQVKERFPNMTVVGSGDVFTAEDVVHRLKTHRVDGVLIARGSIGNPWIFREIRALLAGGPKLPEPDIKEQGEVIKYHIKMIEETYERHRIVPFMRKFIVHYSKRHPHRKLVMMELLSVKTLEGVYEGIKKWYGV